MIHQKRTQVSFHKFIKFIRINKGGILDASIVNVFKDTATVLMRLTTSGTTTFLSLSSEDRSDFLNQLRFELAESVPIDLSRIEKTTRFRPDPHTPHTSDKLLLKFAIIDTKSQTDMNVQQIFETLNEMLKNSRTSPI